MGVTTGISWTDSTWNPIRGCSRVSEGCRQCYAESVAHRFSGPGLAYEGLVQLDSNGKSKGKWNGAIKFVEKHLLDPLKWTKPRRIFVNSMSDLFHENVTDEMRDKIFAVMALCPQHTFQVLTKRPERMLAYLANPIVHWRWWDQACIIDFGKHQAVDSHAYRILEDPENVPWPLPNVHLGVSVENQATADQRIPILLQTPAAVRFISAEPLLGAVLLDVIHRVPSDFDRSLAGFERCAFFYLNALEGANGIMMNDETCHEEPIGTQRRIDWVIVGGESGAGARPMHPDRARSLRDQCKAAGVPFFFKQWGSWLGAGQEGSDHWVAGDVPAHLSVKLAGCLLDGVEHHEFPA